MYDTTLYTKNDTSYFFKRYVLRPPIVRISHDRYETRRWLENKGLTLRALGMCEDFYLFQRILDMPLNCLYTAINAVVTRSMAPLARPGLNYFFV